MKKIIKLNESDLYRIIKRVISEGPPTNPPSSTGTTTTQRPQNVIQYKNHKWYAQELMKIIQSIMSVMGYNELGDISRDSRIYKKNNPTIIKQFNNYAKKVGELLYPTKSDEEKIKVGQDYLNFVCYRDKSKLIKKGESSFPDKLIQEAPDNIRARITELVKLKQRITP